MRSGAGAPSRDRFLPAGILEVPEFDDPAGALVFDPVPRVEGLEASGDPILNFRPGAYELSARQRTQPNCGRP